MENKKEQQMEALAAVTEYNEKLIPALSSILNELREEPKEDTKEYLDYILKGVNWVIQVVNGTKDLLNEKEEVIKRDEINDSILSLNQLLRKEDNLKIADLIEESILPFILKVTSAATEIVHAEE